MQKIWMHIIAYSALENLISLKSKVSLIVDRRLHQLTMENVPCHSDVKEFSEALAKKSNGEYEVAFEHVHSCCVLLAEVDKFKIDGQWYTWIDYEKFHDLVASGRPFTCKDYMALTPSWAVYGADEGGFDPEQLRYKKERRHGSSRKENGS